MKNVTPQPASPSSWHNARCTQQLFMTRKSILVRRRESHPPRNYSIVSGARVRLQQSRGSNWCSNRGGGCQSRATQPTLLNLRQSHRSRAPQSSNHQDHVANRSNIFVSAISSHHRLRCSHPAPKSRNRAKTAFLQFEFASASSPQSAPGLCPNHRGTSSSALGLQMLRSTRQSKQRIT